MKKSTDMGNTAHSGKFLKVTPIKYYDSQNDMIAIKILYHPNELARLEVYETSDSIEYCQKLFNEGLMIRQSP